jgi:hypothetical protein
MSEYVGRISLLTSSLNSYPEGVQATSGEGEIPMEVDRATAPSSVYKVVTQFEVAAGLPRHFMAA